MDNETRELLVYLVNSLVDHPEEVEITETEDGDTVTFKLKTAKTDMGKVIGRQGKIAKEIRSLVKAHGLRGGKRVQVDIID